MRAKVSFASLFEIRCPTIAMHPTPVRDRHRKRVVVTVLRAAAPVLAEDARLASFCLPWPLLRPRAPLSSPVRTPACPSQFLNAAPNYRRLTAASPLACVQRQGYVVVQPVGEPSEAACLVPALYPVPMINPP